MQARPPAREHGAILVLTALLMAALLGATAMGVDIARQVSEKRTVEEVADLAARDAFHAFYPLDMSVSADKTTYFHVFGFRPGQYYQLAVELVRQSFIRNHFFGPVVVPGYTCNPDQSAHITDNTNTGDITLYTVDDNGNQTLVNCGDNTALVAQAGSNHAAIKVVPHTTLNYDFLPGSASVTATGTGAVSAFSGTSGCSTPPCTTTTLPVSTIPLHKAGGMGEFSIGSYLGRATLDAPGVDNSSVQTNLNVANALAIDNAILAQGLGIPRGSLHLDVVSYQGLMNDNLTFYSLATAAGYAGNPAGLLSQTMTVPQLLSDIAAAMAADGDSASLAALGTINAIIAAHPSLSATFTLGQLAALNQLTGSGEATAGSALFTASFNVADLLMGATELALAHGQQLVTASLPVSVPGVASVSVQFGLIQPPQPSGYGVAANPAVTTATTSQIRAQFTLTTPEVTLLPGITESVQVPLYVSGAGATGGLTRLNCDPTLANQNFDVTVSTHAASAQIGTISSTTQLTNPALSPVVTPGTLVTVDRVATITATGSVTVAPSSGNILAFPVNPGVFYPAGADTRTVAGANLGGTIPAALTASTSGGLVPTLLSSVQSVVNGIVNPPSVGSSASLDLVVGPTLASLGLSIGGADVTGWTPQCIYG